MFKEITICKVVKNKKGHKIWRIIRCDCDKSLEGLPAMSGLPVRAVNAPIGTTYKSILTAPSKT